MLKDRKEFRRKFVRRERERYHAVIDQQRTILGVQKIRTNYFIVKPPLNLPTDTVTQEELELEWKKIPKQKNLPKCLALLTGEYPRIIDNLFDPQDDNEENKEETLARARFPDLDDFKSFIRKGESVDVDRIKIYKYYFPHNNADVILKKLNQRKLVRYSLSLEDL